jgi:hypothetical protein
MVEVLHLCNSAGIQQQLPVTVVAQLTADKWTERENEAYISFGMPNDIAVWHLQLAKLERDKFTYEKAEVRRYTGDHIVCEVALAFATGKPSQLKEELKSGGYLTRL